MWQSRHRFLIRLLVVLLATLTFDGLTGTMAKAEITAADPALVLWLDSSDANTLELNGPSGPNSVLSWRDKSSSDYLFNQATARSFPLGPTLQPVPQTSLLGPNNLTSIDFGRNAMLDTTDRPGTNNPLDLSGTMHAFFVANWRSSGGAASSFFNKGLGNSAGDTNYIFAFNLNGGNDTVLFNSGAGFWVGDGVTNGSAPLNAPSLVEISFDASLASDNYKFYVDGAPVGAVTNNTPWLPKEGFGATLGVQGAADTEGAGVFVNDVFFAQGGWVNSFDGQLGELVLYNEVLSPQQQASVQDELTRKWLTLTPSLPSDLTGDGFVDFGDLTLLLAHWDQEVSAGQGNLVDPLNTRIDFQDLTFLLADWTGPGPVGSPEAALGEASVPEPSGLVLALVAALGVCCWRPVRCRSV